MDFNFNDCQGKKILILGLGREGLESLRFFLNCPGKKIVGVADRFGIERIDPQVKKILDENPSIEKHFGNDYLASLDNYDLVVKTPGIPIHLPEIEHAYDQGKITSQTEIFFQICPGIIIGITGTKGKSTTSSIIHAILSKAGKKTYLLGNIGTPMLPYLAKSGPEDIFVCELSAHQLYRLQKSPHIAVFLNAYQEHLDYYKDFTEYIRAKANITLSQSKNDIFIYNSADPEVNRISGESQAQKIAFNEYPWEFKGKTALIGKFNLDNAKIGAIIGRIFSIPDNVINAAISEFKPLGHRLEFVGVFNGIECYNDSLSTIQESAIAAIDGLGERVQTLIAGGLDRGQPFEKLAQKIISHRIKTLILFPDTGEKIFREIQKQAREMGADAYLDRLKIFPVQDMDSAVAAALANTDRGNICLLSAAAASFNCFKDYAQRGDFFKKALASQSSEKNV